MIKGIQMRKEEVKLALFANDRILCIENLRESIKKEKKENIQLVELIDEFSKVAGYRIRIQKLIVFL